MLMKRRRIILFILFLTLLNFIYVVYLRDTEDAESRIVFDELQRAQKGNSHSGHVSEDKSSHSSNSHKSNSSLHIPRCSVPQRSQHVKQQCSKLVPNQKLPSVRSLKHVYVDEKHMLLLCVPYKTGASTHLNLLARNSEQYIIGKFPKEAAEKMLNKLVDTKNRRAFGIRELSSYQKGQADKMLRDYYKVAVVRHPLVRLLSMFMNKVGSKVNGKWTCSTNYYGQYLIEYLKQHYPSDKQECTFPAFLEYLVSNQQKMLKDMHLYPMHSWCYFCQIQYDMIIRLETGDTDQDYLVHNKINPSFNQTLHINAALQTSQNRSESRNFEEIWTEYGGVSEKVLAQLEKMYHNDFALFGYEYDRSEDNVQTSCRIPNDSANDKICC